MDKEPKKMNYAIEPIRKILLAEAISDGGTQKKAAALEGTWIKLNETMFMLIEENQTTLVYDDGTECGCACEAFSDPMMNVLCEHLVAFEDLPNTPQLTIQSDEYKLLRGYLFNLGWHAENHWLYPSPDAPELPEDEASWAPDEEAVEELDPVNKDKPLDIGVDDEDEQEGVPQGYERKCGYRGCNHVEQGGDVEKVKAKIAEHRKTCPMKPGNKQKKPKLVTQEAPEQQQEPVVAKTETTKKPPKRDVMKKPNTAATTQEPMKKSDKEVESTPDVTEEPSGVHKNIAEAMCNIQKTELFAITDSKNPFFNSKYADLASIWSAIRKPLTDNGLAVIQTTEPYQQGITVITTLMHVSGETYTTKLSAKADKQTIQGLGSLITYLRRYSLAALVGVASADDDGEAASGRETKSKER